jgi:hypothetical protein
MRYAFTICLLLTSAVAHAESSVDLHIRNSYLTLSAFECAAVATNDKEHERLFLLGLKAGRDFISYVQANPTTYAKDFHPKVAVLWNMTSGPSPDFILGQIYVDRVDEMYKDFDLDEQLWKMRKDKKYRDKNCALLGK